MWKTWLSALVLSGLLMLVRDASAANYNFVNIADTRGPFDGFQFLPQAVSDTGTVAFVGFQGDVPGTYVGDGTLTNSIAPNIQPPAGFSHLGSWALNESGVAVDLVGRCCDPRHGKIQLHEATGTQTIFELISTPTVEHNVQYPAINNSGTVAFAIYSGCCDFEDYQGSILRWVDGTLTTVVDVTQGFNLAVGVGLNERGDVAFQGYREGAGYSIHRTDGTTLTQIADSSGPLDFELESLRTAINDSGAVAFYSPLDSGAEGIFVGDGGPLTTVVLSGPTTPFYTLGLGEHVAINNQGTVAFFAGLWDGRRGIFTGPDPVNDKVVAHGDFLFGQFVTGLGRPHLNERGDMAFWYEVRDFNEPGGYWTGIALAVKESPLPGDYNQNGIVDAADYTVWRDRLGQSTTVANENPAAATPGLVDAEDYAFWTANFGNLLPELGAGAAAHLAPGESPGANYAVPEPASLALAAGGGLGLLVGARRRPRGSHC
jgi:hypothetical protein